MRNRCKLGIVYTDYNLFHMQLTEITLHFLYRPPTHLTEFCLTLLVVELESSLKIQVSSPTKYVRKTARSVINLVNFSHNFLKNI